MAIAFDAHWECSSRMLRMLIKAIEHCKLLPSLRFSPLEHVLMLVRKSRPFKLNALQKHYGVN